MTKRRGRKRRKTRRKEGRKAQKDRGEGEERRKRETIWEKIEGRVRLFSECRSAGAMLSTLMAEYMRASATTADPKTSKKKKKRRKEKIVRAQLGPGGVPRMHATQL